MSNFMKIRPEVSEMSHAKGLTRRTDGRDEANSAFFFANFVKAPKNLNTAYRIFIGSNSGG